MLLDLPFVAHDLENGKTFVGAFGAENKEVRRAFVEPEFDEAVG
jgi:hypothetical protein